VERPQLTVTALNKGLQMVCDLFDNFLEVNNFMDRCLIFKHTMEAAIATFKKVYKDMEKKAKQPNITPIFTKSPVSNSAIQSASLDHLDNFWQGAPLCQKIIPQRFALYHSFTYYHVSFGSGPPKTILPTRY